jgi:hypothetical protein
MNSRLAGDGNIEKYNFGTRGFPKSRNEKRTFKVKNKDSQRAAKVHICDRGGMVLALEAWKFSLTALIESVDYHTNAIRCNRRVVLPSIGDRMAFVARKKWL